MKIALINDVHIGPKLHFQGKTRAFSHLAEDALSRVIDQIKEVDLLVNLGDLIRSEEHALDLQRYQSALKLFKKASCPVLHLLGNHELKRLTVQEIEALWQKEGFEQRSYGVRMLSDYRIIWLGLDSHHKTHILPKEQFDWLEKELKNPIPTLILSHCAIDDQDVAGNYFYETIDAQNSYGYFLENRSEIKALIAKSNVIAVVQAHLHHFRVKMVGHIPYITLPAMGDNICANIENIPEIYSILSCENGKFLLKSYSREYCFAGYEG